MNEQIKKPAPGSFAALMSPTAPVKPEEKESKGERVKKEAKKTPITAISKNRPAESTKSQPIVKEIRTTLPLPTGSMDFLDQMEREIFLKRPVNFRSKQRLTKNSILRAWVSILKEIKPNINNVEDEQDLTGRLKEALYQLKK